MITPVKITVLNKDTILCRGHSRSGSGVMIGFNIISNANVFSNEYMYKGMLSVAHGRRTSCLNRRVLRRSKCWSRYRGYSYSRIHSKSL